MTGVETELQRRARRLASRSGGGSPPAARASRPPWWSTAHPVLHLLMGLGWLTSTGLRLHDGDSVPPHWLLWTGTVIGTVEVVQAVLTLLARRQGRLPAA